MSLWHCTANGVFGRFGDYVLAVNREAARVTFQKLHGLTPTEIRLERRAK